MLGVVLRLALQMARWEEYEEESDAVAAARTLASEPILCNFILSPPTMPSKSMAPETAR